MSYIVESITNYVVKENTNYAILLNGKWGSGKTYFWDNELKGAIESIEINGKKQQTIYVSLYGITSIDEITKKIVVDNLLNKSGQKVQKMVSGKWGGKITEMAKMGLGIVKSLDVPMLNSILESGLDYENLLDFTDMVVCFDDLERANLEITDILGYINNFVEHDGAKVIIIGNEKEISEKLNSRNIELKMLVSSLHDKEDIEKDSDRDKQLAERVISLFGKTNEYIRIKEKLIGKTLTIIPDYPSLINKIINFELDQPLKEFLNKNLDIIISVFRDSGTENVRILKQGLDDFQLIFHKYQENYKSLGDEVLTSILISTLATSFEIKSGAESNEDLAEASNDTLMNLSFTRAFDDSKKNKKTYIELFVEKYFYNLDIKNNLYFFNFVDILVRKGIFNTEVFTEEMKVIESNTEESTPLYLRLIKHWYWDLSDEEFIEAEKQAYQKLVNGEVHFSWYFQSFILFRDLNEMGLIQKDVKEIKEELLKGLDLAADKAEYYPNLDMVFRSGMLKEGDMDARIFKERLIEINRGMREKLNLIQIKKLMEYMNTNFLKFTKDMNEKYFYSPVFFEYDAEQLFENLLLLTNQNTFAFIDLLEERYKYQDHIKNYKLYLDKDNLILLKYKIDEYVKVTPISLKLCYLKDLSRKIERITKDLEQYQPRIEGSEGEISLE